MISASKEFKEKLKNGANLVNYADITLPDGTVLNLTYKDFMIGGCQIEDKTTDGKFGVGFCIGKTLSLRIANHDERLSQYDFYNSIINLYVALLLDDGTIEKIRKGVYYTIIPETPGDIIEISAVDGMFKLDKDYSVSTTTYPATLQRIISDVCLDCGIPIGFTQFDNMNFIVSEKPENATYRQVLSWACQIAGYNARIDNSGYMQLIWYNTALLDGYNYNGGNFKQYPHDTVIDGGNFTDYSTDTIITGGNFSDPAPEHIFRIKSLSVGTDDVQITGVRVIGDEENYYLFGESEYVIEISGNPFVVGKEQQIATYLGTRMVGMVFRPFKAEVLNNPLYEPFEIVRVSDRKGNVYLSIINSVSYKIGGYTQVSCEAEDPIRNGSEYFSPSAQAVVEARRNTEKQLTTYDKAVQNMNNLSANMMGLFRGQELQTDGSYIYYQSNKPITVDEDGKCHFEENSVVYKNGADGFFVSNDGGKSYTSGFDAQGNAVLNVLAAIGINFDWATGGTLTLGGDNNKFGELSVRGSSGNERIKVNKEGMAIKNTVLTLSSGSSSHIGKTEILGDLISVIDEDVSSIYIHSSQIQLFDHGAHVGHISQNSWWTNTNVYLYKGGSLYVSGTKNRILETNDFGKVLQYCYETPSPMFGDIGEGNLDENGVCYIFFDPVFQETVSSDMKYYVFLQKEGKGDIWVEEKEADYFLVKGTPGLSFSWEAKARQRDYEYDRLNVLDESEKEQEIDYESEAFAYLENYEKEIYDYDQKDIN